MRPGETRGAASQAPGATLDSRHGPLAHPAFRLRGMVDACTFDAELLRRYDRPGPRYTSYPTAPQFQPSFDERALREVARESNDYPIPRPLSLYVHVPFCVSPCFYCGCNRVITRDRSQGAAYLERLEREIDMTAALFDADREVVQLHFGGGTPNFLAPAELRRVVESIGGRFRMSGRRDADVSIELDPRTVTPDEVGELASIGFNRASLGVQDFDPDVQRAVNRVQSVEETVAVIEACREHGMRSVNVDLIYGLPRQTRAGFAKTLDTVIAVRPDRFAVYGYAHLPRLFKAQGRIEASELPSPEEKLALLALAIEKLGAAGYVYIGMDHFALPGDELARAQAAGTLHRNFMGYTTHANTDLVGLGVSAISHVGPSFSQNPRDVAGWSAALDEGRLPVCRGVRLTDDDELRADLIQRLMCHGEIPVAALERRWGIVFAEYFAESVARLVPLVADGLVSVRPERITATSRGRLLLRNIAMCFDRYLPVPGTVSPYSRAI